MGNLDALAKEVNLLRKDISLPNSFKTAYTHIVDALRRIEEEEKDELKQILEDFRDKLSNITELKQTQTRARILDEDMTIASVGNLLKAISERNRAIDALKKDLQVQIDNGHKDAVLLQKIKTMLDQATSTIDGIRGVVKDLTDGNLEGAITKALDTISQVAAFDPNTPSP